MRVNELSKELGKTNKEVLEILQKNHFDVTSHASKITDEQLPSIRRILSAGETGHKAAAPGAEISKSGTGKAETLRVEEIKKEPIKAEADKAVQSAGDKIEKTAETPKKRIAAVYRPQNSSQMKNGRPNQGYSNNRPAPAQTAHGNSGAAPRQNAAPAAGASAPAAGTSAPAAGRNIAMAAGASTPVAGTSGASAPMAGRTGVTAGASAPVAGTSRPAAGASSLAAGTSAPSAGASAPATGVSAPSAGTSAPTAGTARPAAGTSAPSAGASAPAAGTARPAAGTSALSSGASAPAAGASAPAAGASTPSAGTSMLSAGTSTSSAGASAPSAGTSTPSAGAAPSAPAGQHAAQAGTHGGYQGNRDGQRPAGTGYQGNRDGQRPAGTGYQGNRDGQRPAGTGYQGNRDGQRPAGTGYQGNRDGQRPAGTGYQGNRDGQRPEGTGYQGNRPAGTGYQGNRDGQRPAGTGYQGNRPAGSGYQGQGTGYQGNRPAGTGYQGNRPAGTGYQGNRPAGTGYQGQGTGYQGNRPAGTGYQGNRPAGTGYQGQGGGYQGNRPAGTGYQGNRPAGTGYQGQGGGYQGNRPAGGGYQGNRPAGGGYQGQSGGYQGNRDGQRGPGAGAGRTGTGPAKSFDTPVIAKPQNNRQNKNAYKGDKYDKKSHDDTRPKVDKNGKLIKVPVLPPRQREEAKVAEIKTIILPDVLTIKELAEKMKLQPSAIVKKLFLQGKVVTINQEVDYDQAEEIAMEFNVLCEKEIKIDVIEELLKEEDENTDEMVARPPVVCVMGHVDHGKTSLLDAIRQTNVTAKEAGGITQHIGAYMVEIKGQKITFLDTPGHEAFTAMRMRGAKSTDIAILVVAADDGVMPQTIEAINHAKAAGVEIIVAINKVDKPSANVEKVKQELIEYELISEDWGGTTIFVPVSAHTKEGIPELLEMILLTAEVKELRANQNRTARGLVIEAELDKGKGPVATVLVQKGILRVGDPIAAGSCFGKVRAMMDDKGRRVKEAGPSTPVEILGLNDVPKAGEVFVATENDKEARSFAETFISEGKNKLIEDTKAKLSLDDLFTQIKAGNVKELPIVVKADVQGSVEAVRQSLVKISNDEVIVKVIHGGVGTINESDVTLAAASNAIIIGFNVRPDVTAKSIAEREKVDMRLYRVIYQAIEDVEAAMKGMLDPIFEEQIIGHAVVRQTFKASGVGTIAGSYVLDGKFTRGCKTRITRDGEKVYDGPLYSLKRFKDDVKEVATGYECGLVFDKFNDLREDDMIEAYAMVEVPR